MEWEAREREGGGREKKGVRMDSKKKRYGD
jgi:hypothetical protein